MTMAVSTEDVSFHAISPVFYAITRQLYKDTLLLIINPSTSRLDLVNASGE